MPNVCQLYSQSCQEINATSCKSQGERSIACPVVKSRFFYYYIAIILFLFNMFIRIRSLYLKEAGESSLHHFLLNFTKSVRMVDINHIAISFILEFIAAQGIAHLLNHNYTVKRYRKHHNNYIELK